MPRGCPAIRFQIVVLMVCIPPIALGWPEVCTPYHMRVEAHQLPPCNTRALRPTGAMSPQAVRQHTSSRCPILLCFCAPLGFRWVIARRTRAGPLVSFPSSTYSRGVAPSLIDVLGTLCEPLLRPVLGSVLCCFCQPAVDFCCVVQPIVTDYSPSGWTFLLGVGVSSFVSQLLYNRGVQLLTGAVSSCIVCIQVSLRHYRPCCPVQALQGASVLHTL